jgi:hypothetical protein
MRTQQPASQRGAAAFGLKKAAADLIRNEYTLGILLPSEIAAPAAFLNLATVLQAKGLSRCTLIACIDAARFPTHDAPEVLQ